MTKRCGGRPLRAAAEREIVGQTGIELREERAQ
jgi:hypothetical protein